MSEWRYAQKWHYWADGIGMEVSCHNHKKDPGPWEFPCMWATYLLFSDHVKYSRPKANGEPGIDLCPPYVVPDPFVNYLWENREALDCLEGWNGGPTFAEFLVDEKGQRRIKIGDDYSHSWDQEDRRFDLYDLEYMKRRITKVHKQALELLAPCVASAAPDLTKKGS